jgi:hypothetical protein
MRLCSHRGATNSNICYSRLGLIPFQSKVSLRLNMGLIGEQQPHGVKSLRIPLVPNIAKFWSALPNPRKECSPPPPLTPSRFQGKSFLGTLTPHVWELRGRKLMSPMRNPGPTWACHPCGPSPSLFQVSPHHIIDFKNFLVIFAWTRLQENTDIIEIFIA